MHKRWVVVDGVSAYCQPSQNQLLEQNHPECILCFKSAL